MQGGDGFDVPTCLPSRADHANDARIFARHGLGGESRGSAHAHALQHAVREYRQRLAGVDTEQQHQPGIAIARRERQFHLTLLAKRNNVRVQAHHTHTETRRHRTHEFQRIHRIGMRCGGHRIGARGVGGAAVGILSIGLFNGRDAIGHGEQRFGVFVGENQHGDLE